jgi:hypothetical protein
MIAAAFSVRVNRPFMRESLTRDSKKFIDRVTSELTIRARELAPVGSGRLRRSIRSQDAKSVSPTRVRGRIIAFSPYAVYQHEGTGIYGPRHRPIRPVSDETLVFFSRKLNKIIHDREVKGTPGKKFITRAVDELLPSPPWKIIYFTSIT